MSGTLIPVAPSPSRVPTPPAPPASLSSWGAPPASQKTPPVVRVLAVFGRFKWLILGITILGTAAGVVATRFVDPTYQAIARIWIASETPMANSRASNPTQGSELVGAAAWVPLFTSGAVADEVVRDLRLFVKPQVPRDSVLFRELALDERFAPGAYELSVNGRTMQLAMNGQVRDRATLGDSIGRAVGLLWRPDPRQLRDRGSVRFTISPPREVGQALGARMGFTQRENFLTLTLSGTDPELTTYTLQRWLERFVTVATDLKQLKLRETANIQVANLRLAEQELTEAAMALQNFKVGTITLPTENTALAAGVSETQAPVMSSFFMQRQRLEDLRQVRLVLERILNESRTTGEISEPSLFALASLTSGANNATINSAVAELNNLQAQRRAELRIWTDTAPRVLELTRQIEQLQNVTIPGHANALLQQIRQQERDMERRLAGAEAELRDIPSRTTQEQALQRNLDVRAQLYRDLQSRAQAAQLAAAGALPDVSVLDWPVVPLKPNNNTVPQILAMAILGSLAAALALALLLDRIDNRFRYPEQAKDDLGLDILGAVPKLKKGPSSDGANQEALQILESFRLVRLNVQQANSSPGPTLFAVSSACAADGKSLVASNLAVSFAVAGHRVLLIDGDIRRGALHAAFGAAQQPGLSELLSGTTSRAEALRPTQHRNLTLIPCGQRSRQAPELLASAALPELLAQLRGSYDVIIMDCPPLSAGIDAYALGMAAGTMVFVLRAGHTNLRLAQAKLATLDRLPVFLAGAVLNSVQTRGVYEYYSYDYGYAAEEEREEREEREARELAEIAALPAAGEEELASSSNQNGA